MPSDKKKKKKRGPVTAQLEFGQGRLEPDLEFGEGRLEPDLEFGEGRLEPLGNPGRLAALRAAAPVSAATAPSAWYGATNARVRQMPADWRGQYRPASDLRAHERLALGRQLAGPVTAPVRIPGSEPSASEIRERGLSGEWNRYAQKPMTKENVLTLDEIEAEITDERDRRRELLERANKRLSKRKSGYIRVDEVK